MDVDLFPDFKFGKPTAYHAPASSVKPANHPPAAAPSFPVPFAANRLPFVPGNVHQQDANAPSAVDRGQGVGNNQASVGDSGRKSLMTEGGKEVDAGIVNDGTGEMEDESMEGVAEIDDDATPPSDVAPQSRNVFQAAFKTRAEREDPSHRPVDPEDMRGTNANFGSADRGMPEDAEMSFGQEIIENSTLPGLPSLAIETTSQTLAFPTQSVVGDTHQDDVFPPHDDQSSNKDATAMDIDVNEDQHESPVPDSPGGDALNTSDKMSKEVTIENHRDSPMVEGRADKVSGPLPSAKKTAQVNMVASPEQVVESLSPARAQVADSGLVSPPDHRHQRSRSVGRSASSHAVVPDSAVANPGAAALHRSRLLSNRRSDRIQVTQEASRDQAAAPARKAAHRSATSLRSGRVMPSKDVEGETKGAKQSADTISRGAPLTEASVNGPAASARQPSVTDKSQIPPATTDKRVKAPRNDQDARNSNGRLASKDRTAGAQEVQHQQPFPMTANARYQQMLQQSTASFRMTAHQLKAARDAALPINPGVTGVMNRPFATPSKEERQAHLDNLISRSSSPSFARTRSGHPRAAQVQGRRAQTGLAVVSSAAHARGPSHGDGTQDDQLAQELVFRAKEREAEIARRKLQIKELKERNATLETVNANLLTKNAAMLEEKKAAIGKAKELVLKSQEIANSCRQDIGALRQLYSETVQSLELTKNDIRESRGELVAAFNPVSEEVKVLTEKAEKRNENEEHVILAQLRMQYESMGQTTVKLQGDLEEEKTARAAQESDLRTALANVSLLTENNAVLIKENGKLRDEAESDILLTDVKEKFEVEREILCLKIEKQEAENATLTSQHSDLELSLKQATTLIQILEANLQEQKNEKFRIEARLTKDLDASSSLCSSLREEKSKIEKELAVLLAQKEHTDHECKKLADQITVHTKERSVMQEDYEKKLQVQQELSASGEKELQGKLQLVREQIATIKAALGESEATIQHLSRERDAAIGERREVNSLLDTLRKDYDKSLAERDTSVKTSQDLTVRLNERGEQVLRLAAENSELQNRLAAANDSKAKAATELSETKKSRDVLAKEHRATEEKYNALQEALEELEKRAEDGKAAHQEDVTKERAKYEELKAIQDSLKERYQTGDLTTLERDLIRMHVVKIQANHDETIKKLRSELTAAQTDLSLWRKTAGRAVSEKSQKLGGRSLIGSDFDEPSSSPHEALRTAVARRESELVLTRRDAGVLPGQSPTSPLTALNTSSEKQAQQQESQSLSSFLAGGVSVNKRVSFQELADNNSDEMDNDEPDTLGKIAEEDDEREEDIEESESLIEPKKNKSMPVASSIRDYTQAVPRPAITQEGTPRIESTVPAAGKHAQNKGTNASLGMTRTTRSSSQIMTYSGVSRKRGASALAGTDMESFTSTQEDAIYGKRGGLKKQRK